MTPNLKITQGTETQMDFCDSATTWESKNQVPTPAKNHEGEVKKGKQTLSKWEALKTHSLIYHHFLALQLNLLVKAQAFQTLASVCLACQLIHPKTSVWFYPTQIDLSTLQTEFRINCLSALIPCLMVEIPVVDEYQDVINCLLAQGLPSQLIPYKSIHRSFIGIIRELNWIKYLINH